MTQLPDILTTAEAAHYLRVARQTMERWRQKRTGPPYFKTGQLVRYRLEDLQQWAKQRVQGGKESP